MAKRFTDTGKWAKASFSELSAEMKLVWIYLCDHCDHAGIWDINMKLLSFQVGYGLTLRDLDKLGDKIEIVGNKIIIPSFVEFQYGELNPDNRVHLSVINRIKLVNQNKPLISPLQGAKDKDKEKDKDKDKDQDKEKRNFDFEILYQKYPLKKGKSEGIARLKVLIKTYEDYQLFSKSIDKYIQVIHRDGTQPQYIKHFSSFVGSGKIQPWRDFTQDDVGTSQIQFTSKTMSSQLPRSHGNLRAMEEAMKMVDEEEGVL